MNKVLPKIIEGKSLLLFDGVCNLCNSSVQFVIERDPEGKVHFASLQSGLGQDILDHFEMPKTDHTTVVLVENGKAYTRSSAALRVAGHLGGGWKILKVFLIFPKGLRDFFYDFIARNRYKWFGKKDSCMIPGPGVKDRFLDQ